MPVNQIIIAFGEKAQCGQSPRCVRHCIRYPGLELTTRIHASEEPDIHCFAVCRLSLKLHQEIPILTGNRTFQFRTSPAPALFDAGQDVRPDLPICFEAFVIAEPRFAKHQIEFAIQVPNVGNEADESVGRPGQAQLFELKRSAERRFNEPTATQSPA